MIGHSPIDSQQVLAVAAGITTRFLRARLPTESGEPAYQLRIDLELPPGLEMSIPPGLLTEAIQRVGTEILGGTRCDNQPRSGETVLCNVAVLWLRCSASGWITRVFLAEILSGQVPPREVAFSSDGGSWRPYSYATEAAAA